MDTQVGHWTDDFNTHLDANPNATDAQLFNKFPQLNKNPNMIISAMSHGNLQAMGIPPEQLTAMHPELFTGGGGKTPPPAAPPATPPIATPPIPLPNYDDPASRAKYLQTAKKRYGSILSGRGDTLIHVNEVPYGGIDTAKDSATKAAAKVGLDPALLYSSAMEEGMSGLFPDKNSQINTGEEEPDKDYPVNGFFNYGLDNFHDQFQTMVKKGYLPKDFDYKKDIQRNEQGQKVNSANFKTPDDALMAKAAYVKMEQDDIDDYAKKNNIELSPQARQFFTLINFNGGEGTGHRMIDYYKKKGLLDGDKFMDVAPDQGVRLAPSWKNVVPRVKMAQILKKEGLFK